MASMLGGIWSGRVCSALALSAAATLLGGCVGLGWEPANFKATRTLNVAHVAGKAVDVETGNGAISVVRGSTSEVTIVANLKATTQERLDATVVSADRDPDGTLVVRVLWPEQRKGSEGCSFEITVPDAVGVRVDTSNGGVTLAGLAGEAVLETSNGAIKVRDHNGSVHADTSNGAIELVEVGGPVFADTSNGAVTVVLRMDAAGPVNVSSSNGAIDVTLSPEFGGTLDADTSNGSVSFSSLPGSARASTSKGRARIEFARSAAASTTDVENGSAQGGNSRLDTSNGSITIKTRSGV
ncbi:MAG: hypothetical protein GIKADHBN_00289 [Phycisphaerales bacterium]|nr:hypothetical protein [Phycisphaerales bacterium]